MREVARILLICLVLIIINILPFGAFSVFAAEEPKLGNNSQVVTQQIGVKSPSTDLWRAIRQRPGDLSAASQAQGLDAGALINVRGQEWRNFRVSKLVPYTMYVLGGVLLILLLFRLIRGKIKIKAGRSGNKIHRFTGFQRFVHWSVATLFVILAITGVLLTLGRVGLVPLIGKEAFGVIASFGKLLHDYLGPVFAIMLIIMLFTFMKGNVANWVDIKWLLKGGGMFGGHASAGRYNAGEKIWYWIAMIVGAVVVASGLILDFPVFNLARADIELSLVVHAIAAIGLLAVAFGHIFMGTVAMEGAFEAMRTGECDENWAKEHHDLWYQDLKTQGLIGATAAAGVAGASSMLRESGDSATGKTSTGGNMQGLLDTGSVSSNRDANDAVDFGLGNQQNYKQDSSNNKSKDVSATTEKVKNDSQSSSSVEDNLKKIEGIGPKIESILKDAGLTTFADIKNSSRGDIKAILDDAGPRYRMHEPKSWPQQADLADKGAWDELSELQDHLLGGRE